MRGKLSTHACPRRLSPTVLRLRMSETGLIGGVNIDNRANHVAKISLNEEDMNGTLRPRDWHLGGAARCRLRGGLIFLKNVSSAMEGMVMRKTRCATNPEIDREDGAVPTISRACTVGHALLLWAVAGVMFFGGGLTVQAEPATPESPQCTVSDKTVLCTGNLSEGVKVDGGEGAEAGTYTKLEVNNLTTNIVPATWTNGIEFTSDSDIDITVNTGGRSITAEYLPPPGLSMDAIAGIFAHSKEGGNITVKMTGTIASEGGSSDGIFARSEGDGSDDDGFVDITANGNITTNGPRSEGIAANSNGKGAVKVDMTGNITTDGTRAPGISAGSNGGNVEVYTDGAILTKGSNSSGISAGSNGGNVTVNVTGTITTEGGSSEGIAASINSGGNMEVIVNKGAVIKTLGNSSKGISVGGTGIGNEDMEIGVDVKGAVIETSGTSNSSGIFAELDNGVPSDPAIAEENIIDITVDMTGDIKTTGKGDYNYGILARSAGDSVITVGVNGDITTEGTQSKGIFAQAQGEGAVDITVNGDITTLGVGSDGITAEVGDGDGDVLIDVTGDILAKGRSSSAIETSVADGEIKITLHGGSLISEQTIGVEFGNSTIGTVNSLTISEGAAVTISGGNGTDVMGGNGNETINNYGTLTALGTINLGTGNNTFNNMAGATFYSGTAVDLGSDDEDLFSNAGNLSPGGANAVQETTLTGNFQNFITDEQGTKEEGTFTVTIGPENSSDLLTVRGDATLDDGTVRVVGAYVGDNYTILYVPGSNTLSGQFTEVSDTVFMTYSLDYNTVNTVKLISKRNAVRFSDFAATPNQLEVARNVLDSLDDLDSPENTDEGDPIVQAFRSMTETAQVGAGLDDLSGEVHASLKGALMDTAQRPVAAIHRRLTARGRQPDARTSTATVGDLSSRADDQSGFWMIGYDAWSKTNATANTAQMDTDLGGGLFGIDRALGKHGHVGVLGGYSQTSVAQRGRVSSGSVETWSVGLYGGAEAGAARLRFGALYNGHSVTARRTVRVPGILGISERLSARYDARSWQFFAEAGHQLQVRELLLEPFAGVSHIRLGTDGFSETGGTNAALTASSESNSRTLTTLGVRSAMEVKDMVQARGLVGWRHAFGDTDPSSTGTLANSDPFTTLGAPTAQDAVVTELGLEVGLSAHAVFGVAYQGQYGDGVTVHGFNAGLKLTF